MSHLRAARRKPALTLIAGAIAALVVVLGVLQVQAMRASSAHEVARALEQGLGLRARVSHTRLAAARLELVAYGVALDGKKGAVLRARELRIRPSLGALLRGRVDLRSLELHGAVLTLRDGDLPQHAIAREGGWPFSALTARDCRLSWQSAALGVVELERADVELEANDETLRASVQSPAGSLARAGQRHALARVSVAGELDAREIRIERAALDAQGMRMTAREGSFALPLGSRGRADVELDAELARVLELGLLSGLPALAGRVHAAGQVTLARDQFGVEGKVKLDRAQVAGRDLGERIELQLRVTAAGAQLSGALPSAIAGAASADTRFSAVPRLEAGGLRLDALQVQRGKSELRGHARVDQAGALALVLAGDGVALEELAPLLGAGLAAAQLHGRGRVELAASGPLAAPEPRIALQIDDFGVGDTTLGKLDAALRLTEGGRVLQFERAALQSAERKLSADALRLTLDGGLAGAQARLKITELPLADLYRLVGAEHDPLLARLQGAARGSAELSYERAGGEQLELALELQNPTLDGYRFDGGRLRARVTTPDATRGLAAGALALQELTLRAGGGTVRLSGEIRSGSALGLAVAIEKLPVARLPWMQKHAPPLAGQLSGSGKLTGTSAQAGAELDLSCDELAWDGERLGKLRMRAELRRRGDGEARALAACSAGREALASGALQGDSAWLLCGSGLAERARIDLAIGSAAGSPVRGVVQLDRFELAAFLPELRNGERVRGELDATLRIADGAASAPSQLSGVFAVRRVQLGHGDFALASRAPFELAIARGAVKMTGGELAGPKAKLALRAGGTLKQGVVLSAEGKVASGLLTPLLPVRGLFGDMDVELEVDLSDPRKLRGEAQLSDAYVQLETGTFIRKLNGKLLLDGERVRVQDMSAAFGGGMLRAQGTADLRGVRIAGYELELGADRVAFEPQDRFEVAFDASGKLSWREGGPAPKLTGRVMLHKLLYARHVQLPDALIALNRGERAGGREAARDRLTLAIDVEHDQPLVVRNDFLDAEVAVTGADKKLRIVGSDQRLGLLGKLQVLRGRVLFRGDQFRVTRGDIAFDDAERLAPSFDIRGVAEKRKRPDATILFSARGSRDSFDLQVRCEASGPEPPPFTCDFTDNRFRCDSFDDLVRLWVCRPEAQLSSAP